MAETKKPFHETVAEQLIEQLKAGTAPWQRPWEAGASGFMPMNPVTGKRYKGINAIHLMAQGRGDSRWMTYKQAAAAGAQVRKGEKGTPVQYWKFVDERDKLDDDGRPVLDAKGKPVKETVQLERPRVFFATVFNAEQIDGLPPIERKAHAWDAVDRAEHILAASGANISHGGDKAFYRPSTDSIRLPEKGQFPSADRYYATALHELGHWTGHESRLNRDLAHPFGSAGYAREELRAEIASMIVGDELGIGHDPGQHAAYVASWIKALEQDPLEIFRASAEAEKIRDYVLAFEQQQVQEQGQGQQQGQGAGQAEAGPELEAELRERGEAVVSKLDAEARWSAGERLYAMHEQAEEPHLVRTIEELRSYAPDQLLALPALTQQQEPSMTALPGAADVESWALRHVQAGTLDRALDGADLQRLDQVFDALERMFPISTQNEFWTRHEIPFDADQLDQQINSALDNIIEQRRPDAVLAAAFAELKAGNPFNRQRDTEEVAQASRQALDFALPADWTGEVRVVGVAARDGQLVEAGPADTPQAFHLYGRRASDVEPFAFLTAAPTRDAADDLADRLALIDAMSAVDPLEKAAKLARAHEERVRRDPASTEADIADAKEARLTADAARFAALEHGTSQTAPAPLESLPGHSMTYNGTPGMAGVEVLTPDGELIAFGGRPALEAFIAEQRLSDRDAAALRTLDAQADQHRMQPQYADLAGTVRLAGRETSLASLYLVRVQDANALDTATAQDGALVLKRPPEGRNTFHFTLNSVVETHAYGRFDGEAVVIAPLVAAVRGGATPSGLGVADTWFHGDQQQSLRLPNATLVLPAGQPAPEGVNVVRYERGATDDATLQARNDAVRATLEARGAEVHRVGFDDWHDGQVSRAEYQDLAAQLVAPDAASKVFIGRHASSPDGAIEDLAAMVKAAERAAQQGEKFWEDPTGAQIPIAERIQSLNSMLRGELAEAVQATPSEDARRFYRAQLAALQPEAGRDRSQAQGADAAGQGAPAPTTEQRVYIDVPYKQKDEAKQLGARWDRAQQSWYVPPGVDLAPFGKWTAAASTSPAERRADAGVAQGATPAEKPRQEPRQERLYLAVPYGERQAAKAAGALWDAAAKSWYAGPKADMGRLARWRPENVSAEQGPAMTVKDEFTEALRSLGCVVTDQHPIMDGTHQRIQVEGDKKGERSGFYVGHVDGAIPAGYIKNNRTGVEMRWKAKGYALSPEDKAKLQAEAARTLAERAATLERQHEATAERVRGQLGGLVPVEQPTAYLAAKGIEVHAGIYTDKAGQKTYVPVYDADGKQWSMQYIQEDGTKRFAKDSRKDGCFHPVGGMDALAAAPMLVIAEGYATAATLAETVGHATVAAFDSGNLPAVARSLHAKFPDKPIVIAGEDDRHQIITHGTNPGRTKAEEAARAVGGKAIFPIFAPGENTYPADLAPITPETYREHENAARRLERAAELQVTEAEAADLKRALLAPEQLDALAHMKQHTDFNDLATRSALGREGLQRQVTAAVSQVLQAAERSREQAQQAEQRVEQKGEHVDQKGEEKPQASRQRRAAKMG